jgi:TRAP-type C4-dicarboxylate transport system permease small subunit
VSQATKAFTAFNDLICRLVKGVLVCLASVMVAAILWQVFMRYVFNQPPSWTEELALLMFTWSMLLMTALGVREFFHVRMDLMLERLPMPAKDTMNRFVCLGIAAFGCYLAWAGYDYVKETVGSRSAAIGYAIEWLHAAAPVTGGLIALFAVERMLAGVPE